MGLKWFFSVAPETVRSFRYAGSPDPLLFCPPLFFSMEGASRVIPRTDDPASLFNRTERGSRSPSQYPPFRQCLLRPVWLFSLLKGPRTVFLLFWLQCPPLFPLKFLLPAVKHFVFCCPLRISDPPTLCLHPSSPTAASPFPS